MEVLDLACYRRQCITFVGQELWLLDCEVPERELQLLFEQFLPLVDIRNQSDRLTLVLLMIARLAFEELFTQQEIPRLMDHLTTAEDRQQQLQQILFQQGGYDTEFLHRKSWI